MRITGFVQRAVLVAVIAAAFIAASELPGLSPGVTPSAASHVAPVDGSAAATACENLVDDFLGFIDIPQPGWVYVNPSDKYKDVAGPVEKAQVTHTDFPTVHDSHDFNGDIDPDDDFEGVLSTGNTNSEIEIEWEIGTKPEETGSDPERTFPKWAWPNAGDRAWVNGAWIFDCGHPADIGGTDHYKSEIHPPRAIAAMRDQVRPIPGTGTTPVRVTATDLYIHGQAGFVTEDLECGQDVILDIFGGCAQSEPHRGQPIDANYAFDICVPAKPVDSAVLATTFEDGPNNNIGTAPVLTTVPATGGCVDPAFGPVQVHVEIPLAGTGVAPDRTYARRIFAGWIYPTEGLKHLSVTLTKGDLHDDQDVDPGDCECSFFWVSNNRAPDEWHRLVPYEIPTLEDFGLIDPCFDQTNVLDDWDSDEGCGNGILNFSGPNWDFYVVDGMDYRLRTVAYDQDCLDDLFGDHNLIVSGLLMGDCYAGTGPLTLEAGDNDSFGVAAKDFNGLETGEQSITNGANDFDLYFNTTSIPVELEDSADLSLTKICKPDDIGYAGQQVTCTILVDNPGPGLPRNVVVDDTMLTNVALSKWTMPTPTFVFEGFAGSPTNCDAPNDVPNGRHFTCNLGSVPVGGSAIITATFTTSEGGDFNNRALVTTESIDPNTSNNEGIDGLTVRSVADLSVKKNVGAGVDPVTAGTGFVYTIEAKNDGPSAAANVVVTDVVPAGMAVVSATVPGGSCAAGVPGSPFQPTRCSLGTMAPAETRNVQISVLVAPDTLGQVNNDAAISSDTLDFDNSDNVATRAITVVASADVSTTKSASPSPSVVAGTALTYTLTVSNAGPSLARNVVLTDTLPQGLSFTGFSGGGSCSILAPVPGGIVCTLGNMNPGTSATVYANTMVLSSTTASLSNTAEATSTTPDPAPSNNTSAAVASTVLTRADLAVVKTSDKDVYKPSSQIKYTITVTNNGPSDALNVVVTDNLPDTKQAIYNFDTAGCAKAGLVLTCNLGTIPSGSSKTFNVYETVKGSKGQVVNKASVASGTTDPVAANNASTRTVLIGK